MMKVRVKFACYQQVKAAKAHSIMKQLELVRPNLEFSSLKYHDQHG